MKASNKKNIQSAFIIGLISLMTLCIISYLLFMMKQQKFDEDKIVSLSNISEQSTNQNECKKRKWPVIDQGTFSGTKIGKYIQMGRQRMVESYQAGFDCVKEYNDGEISILYTLLDKLDTHPSQEVINDPIEFKNTMTWVSIPSIGILLRGTTSTFNDVVAYETTHMVVSKEPVNDIEKKNVTAFGKAAIELTFKLGVNDELVKLIVPRGNKVYIFYSRFDTAYGELTSTNAYLATFQFKK